MPEQTKQQILFITSSRIGDAVLSSGLLDHIARTYPQSAVTIACGPLVTSLFEGYPNLGRLIPLRKQRYHGHWIGLWRDVAGTRWESVVDVRNSAVSRLIPACKRHIFGRHIDQNTHKVGQMAAVMRLLDVPVPRLWFSAAQIERARTLIPEGTPVLGVGPSANWIGKTWPAERFIEIINWMTAQSGLMPGARVAVFAAPGEEDSAQRVLGAIPEARRLDLIAKTDPGTAAAALARCDYYIGNDSGLMHCAAAAGTPVLGLFGPSRPAVYRPWGKRAAYVATPESMEELTGYDGYDSKRCGCLMESLGVDAVAAAIKKNWPQMTASF